MRWLCIRWETASSVLLTLAAVAGVWIAYEGLKTWKRQLRGSEDHELAKKVLRAALNLEDKFAWLRHRQVGLTYDQAAEISASVRSIREERWERFHDEASQLGSLLDEAGIIWGEKFEKLRNDLGPVIRAVRSALEDVLEEDDSSRSPEKTLARQPGNPAPSRRAR